MRKKRANDWLPPTNWTRREALREKGQFWTPPWVAEAMVAYASAGAETIFDPAVGAGAFFRAAKALAARGQGRKLKLSGAEIDQQALRQATDNELTSEDLQRVEIRDFVLDPPRSTYEAICSEPPLREAPSHQARSEAVAPAFRAKLYGPFAGRARRASCLLPASRAADDGPQRPIGFHHAGGYVRRRFRRISLGMDHEQILSGSCRHFFPRRVSFSGSGHEPGYLFHKERGAVAEPALGRMHGARRRGLDRLGPERFPESLERHDFRSTPGTQRGAHHRAFAAAGRATAERHAPSAIRTVQRGIVTGANEFFFLTKARAAELQIPDEFLKQAIGRTRDLTGDVITEETFHELDQRGRPTLLLSLDNRPFDLFPSSVKNYIRQGEAQGLPKHVLLSTRNPWYKMEVRAVPPILFAYLGRRNVRFIRNLAGALPLTCFLCVFPRQSDEMFYVDRLWEVLASPETLSNLRLVGKSYGSGAIKVEPRALERVILPRKAIDDCGLLHMPLSRQLSLLV